ncbi:PaaI family thioesterase [Rhodococcus sp. Eu-32]|nr:PaaI family thioesterase [Rhodococcus sp. Eu-32]
MSRLCSGCRTAGSCRLGLGRPEYDESGFVAVRVVCDPTDRGGPITAHGGWIAAVFDDALAYAVLQHNPRIVTADLSVRYRRPVPVSTPLTVTARATRTEQRRWISTGELALADTPSAVLATAYATFATRPHRYYKYMQNDASNRP